MAFFSFWQVSYEIGHLRITLLLNNECNGLNADFNSAIFSGDTYFDLAIFSSDADFHLAKFSGNADFSSVRFGKSVDWQQAELDRLSPESFDSIGLAYRRSFIDGGGWFFEQAGKNHWNREYYLNAYNKNRYADALNSFRNAKVEYGKEGKYSEAGQMYVKEKEATRLNLKLQGSNHLRRSWLWIWKYTSNYGESPWRFIGWVTAIVLVFALIYMPIISTWSSWWPSITFEKYPFHQWSDGIIDGFAYNIVTALYFSAVTFATLGLGDIAPVNILGKVCAIAEVLLGYLMFGMLFILAARKMTRS